MEQQLYVQKRWIGGGPVGPPRPIGGGRPFAPTTFTAEGVNAVAGALAIELQRQPVRMSGLPPEVQLAEGLQRIAEGG